MTKFTVRKDQLKEITLKKPGKYLVELVGAGARIEIKGVFQTKNTDKLNTEIVIHHKAPHTHAETILKGVARDESMIRFYGKIIIDEKCGDSQSFLTERILLLSPKAKAEAIPDLEIKTDDVQCSHAASVSNISEEHVFYLQTRGLPKVEAEKVIVEGFLDV